MGKEKVRARTGKSGAKSDGAAVPAAGSSKPEADAPAQPQPLTRLQTLPFSMALAVLWWWWNPWDNPRNYGGSKDNSGCWPLTESSEARSSWLVTSEDRLNIRELPNGAKAFVCYDGRAAPEAEEDPGFRDTAVVLVEDFLSAAEIEHMKAAVEKHVQPSGHPGYSFRFAAGAQYPSQEEDDEEADPHYVPLPEDAVLNEVERRIADLVGVALSGEETPLQFSQDVPPAEGAEKAPPNVHHDKNHGLVRHVTVLIYLSSVEEGGETIFPALPQPKGAPMVRSEEQRRYAKEFSKIVASQITENPKLVPGGEWPDVQVLQGSDFEHELAGRCPAEAKARGASPGGADGVPSLAVKPAPGRAIIFWHEVAEGDEPLLDVFHAGCPVRRGQKLSLQKFKNFAKGTIGCHSSKWCRKFF